jgi:hypothetical protein
MILVMIISEKGLIMSAKSICPKSWPAHHTDELVKKSTKLLGPDYEGNFSPKPFDD